MKPKTKPDDLIYIYWNGIDNKWKQKKIEEETK